MTIIAPISRLKDPLGVLNFKASDQNKLLLLKRFGELYRKFKIRDSFGSGYVFCRYIPERSSWNHGNQPKPKLIGNSRNMDERPDFKASYVTTADLKRIQRYLNWKAFWSRVERERRLYKLIVEKESFMLHALHTFVHAWLPELPNDFRGKSSDPDAGHDVPDREDIYRKLYTLEEQRADRIASIRVLPTTTDPRMM